MDFVKSALSHGKIVKVVHLNSVPDVRQVFI